MSIRERAAFLRGLLQGLDIDNSTPERKLILALIETIDEIAEEIEELSDVAESLEEEIEEISDRFEDLEGGCCSHEAERGALLDLQCPACGSDIGINREMLSDGRFPCPYCGENLEIGNIGGGEDGPSDEGNSSGEEN